jgi:hypothetical protein
VVTWREGEGGRRGGGGLQNNIHRDIYTWTAY